jgi:hypothetical protein
MTFKLAEIRAEENCFADGGEPITVKRTFRFEVSVYANAYTLLFSLSL